MGVLLERSITRLIHTGIDRPIHKGLPGCLSGLHDEGHSADAEKDGDQTRCKGTPAMEEDAYQHRYASHGQADNRKMVDRQMNVGRGE